MAWRDNLRQGKFRDAEFVIESDGMSFGRRNELHEFPGRDTPYVEDLGRKARVHNVECYVIGPNYMSARDKLIEALEAPGPGTLVHPYLGTMRVSARKPRMRESTRDGGMAKFTITFVESGENTRPDAVIDTRQVIDTKADEAIAAVAEDFAKSFGTDNVPEFVRNGALDDLNSAIDSIDNAIASIPGLEALGLDLSILSGDLPGLIGTPSNLAGRFTGLLGSLKSKVTSPLNSLTSLRGLFSFGDELPTVATTTPSRTIQAANQGAVTALIRRSAIIEATRATAAVEYENYTQAITTRDELAERLDEEMETADDSSYQALGDLRIALVRDIADRGTQLPRLSHHTPATTLPALVVAHQVYGDANRDGELISRNNIRHPGFVSGGDALEVLSDV
ncbi:MAG: DNA circularization N-terminal domain-containing protein [Candidatus Sedimenticola sp. (ex Thyasira tokunagai)]